MAALCFTQNHLEQCYDNLPLDVENFLIRLENQVILRGYLFLRFIFEIKWTISYLSGLQVLCCFIPEVKITNVIWLKNTLCVEKCISTITDHLANIKSHKIINLNLGVLFFFIHWLIFLPLPVDF